MAETTANLGLTKPAGTDYADIAVLNDNWDKLDAAVAEAARAAEPYDPSGIYAAGDYCVVDGVLYRCVTPIPAGETWNAAHWTATSLEGELKALREGLAGKAEANHTHTPASIGAAPAYTYGTTDLTAGSSTLTTGKLYFVYE